MQTPTLVARSPLLRARTERLLLQIALAAVGFVPVLTGFAGALLGGGMTGEGPIGVTLDDHVRFLSGLLIGLGLALWEAIPTVERRGERLRLLTAIFVLGGLMRLVGILFVAMPPMPMLLALPLDLAAMPAICLWQTRVARRCGMML